MPTTLITGASRGLGLEFTRQYLADGWDVIACCRDPEQADELAALAGPKLNIHGLDVADFAAIDALSSTLSDRPIDVLINNAGIMGELPLAENLHKQHFGKLDYAIWESIFRINTFAPVKMAEAFIGQIGASAQKKLVNISSTVGSMSEMTVPAIGYSASKTALNRTMTIVADSLKEKGIIVALLCPGYVKTRMDFAGYATVEADASIAGMRALIEAMTLEQSGKFMRYNGEPIGW